MDKQPLMDFVRSHVPASNETLAAIVGYAADRVLAKNELLLKAGKVSNEYFFLTDGVMRAFTLDTNGNEVTTNFFSKNHPVFEVSSLFMRTVSAETIQAATDCTGYVITFVNINKLFHTIPEFREFGRLMLVKEFAAFKQRALSLINQSAEERYAELMRTRKDVFQYAQLQHIASYLGMTDSSLSRIRRELARKE